MRVGIVGDIHEPFAHPMYSRFVEDIFNQWEVQKVHFIGDIVDAHALGFWDHDPDGSSAEDESEQAFQKLVAWKKLFPTATVSIGNHDERHFRVAKKAGLPSRYLRDYKTVWDTPKWDWGFEHIYDGALYEHGTGSSGKDAAINRAIAKRCNLVMGHTHTYAGVKYHTNDFNRIFGLQVGCGIDIDAYAFAYGKTFPVRPVLGCGVVINGSEAYFEPMPCGPNEKYHRSRA